MDETTTRLDLNDALGGLLEKYAVEAPGPWRIVDGRESPDGDDLLTLLPGASLPEPDPPELTVPLLPWRDQRRFVELKRLVDEKTVAPLLMCRFACLTDAAQTPLEAILYREFDLIEWLSGTPIVSICASMAGKGDKSNYCEARSGSVREIGLIPFFAANVIVRLAGGVIGSVEAGATLPAGTAMQDRHELIARRGVASDRVVDTQVPQSSVHAWTAAGHEQHTDVDAELFGLDAEQAALVRSAYDVLHETTRVAELRRNHARLRQLVELAYESDRRHERLAVDGEGGSR